MTSPTTRGYFEWQKKSPADDFLQLKSVNGAVVGGFDPNGVGYGSLASPPALIPTPDWFNVKTYGAQGDAQQVFDAAIASTTTITSATANFTSGDVGKIVYLILAAYGYTAALGVITGVTNSTTIVCTGIDPNHVGNVGNTLVWGTDDTIALEAAWAAASANTGDGKTASVLYVPDGGYIFSKRVFTQTAVPGISIIGDGPHKTVFYPHPSFDFTSVNANSGMLTSPGVGDSTQTEIANFSINGCFINFTSVNTGSQIFLLGLYGRYAHDIIVEDLGTAALTGGVGGIYQAAHVTRNVEAIQIDGNYSWALSYGNLYDCLASNGQTGYYIFNVNYSAYTGDSLTMVNCFGDESGTPSLQIVNSNGATFIGSQFYSQYGGGNSVSVDGVSIVRFIGCNFGPYFYSALDSGGLSVASGGIAYIENCDLRNNTGGYAITNNGTVYDIGGNSITREALPWVNTTTYGIGYVVSQAGINYVALSVNVGQNPSTDMGVHWSVVPAYGQISGSGNILQMTNNTTATSASAGSNGDVPAQVVGYKLESINGTVYKIPYYAV